MNWLKRMWTSSIGKKIFMASSGLLLVGFLLFHLAGNFTIFGGTELFSGYVHLLHSAGPLVYVAEVILGCIFLAHILLGIILTLENWRARPQNYAVNNNRGGQTFSSVMMKWSGLLILVFLIIHLLDYTVQNYANHWTPEELTNDMISSFQAIWRVVFYVLMVIVVGIHVNHGFWSLFQSLGLGSERHTPSLKKIATTLGFIFAIGFGCLPLYAMSLFGK